MPAFSRLTPSHRQTGKTKTAVRAVPANFGLPQPVDITGSTGIHFDHLSSLEDKYIVESMSGGVAIVDYNGDGWPDIYFTNAPTIRQTQWQIFGH